MISLAKAESIKLKNNIYWDTSGIDHLDDSTNNHINLSSHLAQTIGREYYNDLGEAGWYKVVHIPATGQWSQKNAMFSIMPTIFCYGAGGIFTVSSYNGTDMNVRVLAGSLSFGDFKAIKESDNSIDIYYKTTGNYTGVRINCISRSDANLNLWDGCGYVGTTEPTGTIISIRNESVQSGSNDNGTYTKFADGTLICRNSKKIGITTPKTIGPLYYGYVENVGDFPHAFTSVPTIAFTHFDTSDCITLQPYGSDGVNAMTNTSAGGVYPITISQHTDEYTITISYIAIGRWK